MSFTSPDLLLNGLSLTAFQFNCQPQPYLKRSSMSLPRLHTQMAVPPPHHYHHPYLSYPQQHHRGMNNRKWIANPRHSGYPPQQQMLTFPPSPSDSVSSSSVSPIHSPLSSPPPYHRVTFVQCTAPLLAPKPLPYHSPRFLQFDELPETEEDLSHPPYVRRPQKRKREQLQGTAAGEADDDATSTKEAKRSRNGSTPKQSQPRSRQLPRSHARQR